jgi:hypothetical protein
VVTPVHGAKIRPLPARRQWLERRRRADAF